MGVLNTTPDSFSDGGRFVGLDQAVARAWEVAKEGADILDIGGESTRPGAIPVSEQSERDRVWPVLEKLAEQKYPLPISLDTTKPKLVFEAFQQGLIQIINDVEGLRNPDMVSVVKELHVPLILMHMFGKPRTMQKDYFYKDVVCDLISFFSSRLEETGISENVVLDPGLGFGKGVEHNVVILHRLSEFKSLGYPLLVGASRKTFIGEILDAGVNERLEGSLAVAAIAVYNGASILRVHDVAATVKVVKVIEAISKASPAP